MRFIVISNRRIVFVSASENAAQQHALKLRRNGRDAYVSTYCR